MEIMILLAEVFVIPSVAMVILYFLSKEKKK